MVRKAQISDIFAIKSIIDLAAKKGEILPRTKKEITEIIDSFFVYERKKNIIGCCSLEIYSQKIAEVRSLVVLPKYRNQGIGTCLVKECLKEAEKKGIYEVMAITGKVSLFRKVGFHNCINDQVPMFIKLSKNKRKF